ncbi:MAG: hypothetical protein R6U40_14530 [Desulfobacterales bacterium]
MEFGEWLCHEVVKAVPHRHAVLSIPKILRRYFLYDRKLHFSRLKASSYHSFTPSRRLWDE